MGSPTIVCKSLVVCLHGCDERLCAQDKVLHSYLEVMNTWPDVSLFNCLRNNVALLEICTQDQIFPSLAQC